jgi:hypothetical protein
MFTLIIVTFFAAINGGASTTTTFQSFPDQTKCQAASKAIRGDGQLVVPARFGGVYRIIATCVAQ